MTANEDDLPVLEDLDQLAEVVERERESHLYIRWSVGPATDAGSRSTDELTGVPLPGLSANPLRIESWWGDRSPRLWVARRLYDYQHLRDRSSGPGVRAWLLRGREVARGPDNEPLVHCEDPLAWVAEHALQEARGLITEHNWNWGSLDRHA